jgi:hypothetical protein
MKRSVEWLAEYEGRVARWRKIAREWNGDNIELVELTSGEPVPVLADRNQPGSSLTINEDARTRKDRERPLAPVTSSPSMPTEGGAANQPAPGAPPSPAYSSSAAPSKFRNVKTDGYASKKEASRAFQLRLMQEAGQIRNLREQVEYELIPKQDGERSCRYRADFVYEDFGGHEVVEDTKGVKTPDYIIKRKLMLFVHGIRISEV